MSTPAKDRFMNTLMETTNALEYNCLRLTQDAKHFSDSYLTHSLTIITGMVQNVRKHLIVNKAVLINLLPKGVLSHGETKSRQKRKTRSKKS